MLARTLTTLGIWALLFTIIYIFGFIGGVLLIGLFSAATQLELYRIWEKLGMRPHIKTGIFWSVILLFVSAFFARYYGWAIGPELFGVGLSLAAVNILNRPTPAYFQSSFLPTIGGVLIVPFCLYFLIEIIALHAHEYSESEALVLGLWLIAIVKFTDVGGLLIGKKWGRRRFAPSISPGKTWEGVGGGILLSCLVAVISVWLLRSVFPKDLSPLESLIIAIPLAIMAVLSDLLESVFKRFANQKDSGNTIPGIGGVYDLTDSLLLTMPLASILLPLCIE